MVLLITSDNEQFVVDKEAAERSVLIKNMLEGGPTPSLLSPIIPYLTAFSTCRCRRKRRAYPIAQCFFVSAEKGKDTLHRARKSRVD